MTINVLSGSVFMAVRSGVAEGAEKVQSKEENVKYEKDY